MLAKKRLKNWIFQDIKNSTLFNIIFGNEEVGGSTPLVSSKKTA